MRRPTLIFVAALTLSVVGVQPAAAQDAQHPPKLVICGGGALPASVFKRFRQLAGEQPRLVVIPTASEREADARKVQELWGSRGFEDVGVLHTNDREAASEDGFAEPLRAATAVWFNGGSQQRIADAYLGTAVEKELYALVRRGGVVGGTSAGAAIQSRVMIASGRREPRISTGFDLLRGAVVDQHFLKRNRLSRLTAAVGNRPDLVGYGVDEGTALVVKDHEAEVVGKSYVLRVQSVGGRIRVDAFNSGESVPLPST